MRASSASAYPPPPAGASQRLTYFSATRAAYALAEHAGGGLERRFCIDDLLVCIRFAGPALVPSIATALEHLQTVDTREPDLTICVWDDRSTRTEMPAPPWSAADYVFRGEIRGYNDQRIRTAYQAGLEALSLLDQDEDLGLYWVRGEARPSYQEKPLQVVLNWWLARRDRQLVHAAAVGTPAGSVLLAGRGGSGKSVSSLACLRAGLTFLGDDYVMLRVDPSPVVCSLYNSIRVAPSQLPRFPEFAGHVANVGTMDGEKALIFAHRCCPEQAGDRMPLQAVFLPRLGDRPGTTWRPAPPAAAITALCTSTVFALPGAGREVYAYVNRLIGRVPCFYLDLGRELSSVPEAIRRFLSGESR